MKVVIDTNIFISGIFWKGAPRKLIDFFVEGKFEVFATTEIIQEYFRIIDEIGVKRAPHLIDIWKSIISHKIIIIENLTSLALCRDHDDDKFINCALSCKVDYLISGDKDLIDDFTTIEGVKVTTVSKFLDLIKG